MLQNNKQQLNETLSDPAMLWQLNHTLQQYNDKLRDDNQQLHEQVAALKHQLEWFKRQVFGRTSEKRLIDIPGQGNLLQGLVETHVGQHDVPTEQVTYERKKPNKARHNSVNDSGLRFDETVEVKEIRLSVPELEGPDADQYLVIDEHVTCRLAQRRSSYLVLKYIQPVIKRKDSGLITTVSAPTPVFEKSIADVSFIVGMMIDKFLYHQPLHRQHQKLALSGMTLSRTTLTNLVRRAIALLEPIYDALLLHILLSKVLAMDETPIKAGRRHQGVMRQAWYWPVLGEDQDIAFHYAPTRACTVVDELLKDFKGTLVTDGYVVYDSFVKKNPAIIHAQCWMHNRRNYVSAEKDQPQAVAEALDIIGSLFHHEQCIKEKQPDVHAALHYRSEHCKPIVDQFFEWVHTQCQRLDLLPKSPFAKALKYSVRYEEKLKVFLSDPAIPMDTGAVERAIRPIPMGQRNWLFHWTEIGAKQTGIIQSLIQTCRMHNINPTDYLIDVLQRVSMHPASKVEELTPRVWKTKYHDNFLRSDVDR